MRPIPGSREVLVCSLFHHNVRFAKGSSMKRITYISRLTRAFDRLEIQQLGLLSEERNRLDGITGVLLCFDSLFFQVLEGEPDRVDALFAHIRRDPRHKDLLCLRAEDDIPARRFPDWPMHTCDLDELDGLVAQPVQVLFQLLVESYDLLAKYTHPAVVRLLCSGLNPLQVRAHCEEKVILFSDMSGFSLISALLTADELLALVNDYFAFCSQAITRSGGEVMKFMGDCIMAQFAREAVDGAVEAALSILDSVHMLRRDALPGSPLRALYCGIGLACGEVIEGNIGSSIKMEYTVLGDPVNKAAQLQNLTRSLNRSLLFSSSVRERLAPRWQTVPMGEHAIKSQRHRVPVFSIDDSRTLRPPSTRRILKRIARALDRNRSNAQPVDEKR